VIERFLARGPCTLLLDELDHLDTAARKRLQRIWNIGHERSAEISLMIGGEEKYLSVYAPMLAAGIGSFLAPTQRSRTFTLEMTPYTEATKPERDYNTDLNVEELDAVYSYLCNWARKVKLNPRPSMPAGVIRRFADDARGLLAIADSCSAEWGRRAREAMVFLLEKEKAERPQITLLRHGLAIFDALEPGLDQIKSTRYRGPSGTDYAHPLEMHEQATLLAKVDIESTRCRSPRGRQFRGYRRAQFEEAWRKHGAAARDKAEPGRSRLRLISSPQSD
jgi:hypothetical protein